jgi:hypothetical protein
MSADLAAAAGSRQQEAQMMLSDGVGGFLGVERTSA